MHRRGSPCGKSASRAQINRRKSFSRGRREWGIVCVGTPPQKMLRPNDQVYSKPVSAQNSKRKEEWDSARGNRIPPIKMCRVVSVRENFPSLFFWVGEVGTPQACPHTSLSTQRFNLPPCLFLLLLLLLTLSFLSSLYFQGERERETKHCM